MAYVYPLLHIDDLYTSTRDEVLGLAYMKLRTSNLWFGNLRAAGVTATLRE